MRIEPLHAAAAATRRGVLVPVVALALAVVVVAGQGPAKAPPAVDSSENFPHFLGLALALVPVSVVLEWQGTGRGIGCGVWGRSGCGSYPLVGGWVKKDKVSELVRVCVSVSTTTLWGGGRKREGEAIGSYYTLPILLPLHYYHYPYTYHCTYRGCCCSVRLQAISRLIQRSGGEAHWTPGHCYCQLSG